MNIWHFKEQQQDQVIELEKLPDDGFVWVESVPAELPEINLLIEKITGSPLLENHLEDCLNPHHPCTYDTTNDYDILIFHSLTTQIISEVKTQPIIFILFKKLIITINHTDYYLIRLHSRLSTSRKWLPDSTVGLAYFILNVISDQFLELRKPMTEYLLEVQEKLLAPDHQFDDWNHLFSFKADIRSLSMISDDQHDAIEQWRRDLALEVNDPFTVRLKDIISHATRMARHARNIENELETLIQLHYTIINNRTNEIMRILTLVAAIFLPLTFITGIFGMNFQFMSVLHHPYGYYGTLIGMAGLTGLLLSIFKWQKWI